MEIDNSLRDFTAVFPGKLPQQEFGRRLDSRSAERVKGKKPLFPRNKSLTFNPAVINLGAHR